MTTALHACGEAHTTTDFLSLGRPLLLGHNFNSASTFIVACDAMSDSDEDDVPQQVSLFAILSP